MNKERKGVRTRRSCATGRRTRANAANGLAAMESGYTPPADNTTSPLCVLVFAVKQGSIVDTGQVDFSPSRPAACGRGDYSLSLPTIRHLVNHVIVGSKA